MYIWEMCTDRSTEYMSMCGKPMLSLERQIYFMPDNRN